MGEWHSPTHKVAVHSVMERLLQRMDGYLANRHFLFRKWKIMIPRKIFTKRFFELSDYDQAAVVRAIIRDIEDTIGCHLDLADDRKAEQRVTRIRAGAKKHGIDGV